MNYKGLRFRVYRVYSHCNLRISVVLAYLEDSRVLLAASHCGSKPWANNIDLGFRVGERLRLGRLWVQGLGGLRFWEVLGSGFRALRVFRLPSAGP